MNPTEDDLNPNDDPLATADPFETYDPEMTTDGLDVTTGVATNLEPPEATSDPAFDVTLAEEEQSEIIEICSKFESAWRSGDGQPLVEEYVPDGMDSTVRQLLVRELVLLDIGYREKKDISLETTAYLSKLPDCKQAVESAFSHRRASVRKGSRVPKGYGNVTPAQTTRGDGRVHSVPARSHDPTSRYRPTHFHARGGLGAVFRARDEELKRLVALKEILPDHAENVKCQDRFIFEAEVTGSLEHPGIVPVYGLGRYQDKRPYYAMRFIRGRSFRDVIAEFHKEHASSSSGSYLSREFRMLLRRFIEACNAIHYAHEHGVLHRDIKPDNIMLGKYGETLVVDWGLAKLIDADRDHISSGIDTMRIEVTGSSSHTSQGSAVGTPMYMSPEQAMGMIDSLDSRTDVYSLGAMLFNIITGKHAVDGKTGREIVINVRAGNTKALTSVTPQAPRPLESICRKAMELKPADRYPSAVELAEDLDRWMSDEAVHAHLGRERITERAGRWIRRYRSWTISGAVALLAITTVAVVSALLINHAKQKEQIARQEADARKQDAVARYRDSRDAIDTWLVQSSDALEHFPGTQTVRQRLLEMATEDYRGLASKASDDPELELERGRATVKLGDLLRRQEDHNQATQRYNDAIALLDPHTHDPQWGLRFQVEKGNVHSKLALAFLGLGKIEDAQREFMTAIDDLSELAESDPDDDSHRLLAVALVNAGQLDWEVGRTDVARERLGAALSHYGELLSDDDAQARLGVAKVHMLWGNIDAGEGIHDSALAEFNQAITDLKRLVKSEPDHPDYLEMLAEAQIAKAASYRTQGLEVELLAALHDAIDSYAAIRDAMPNVPRYNENYAIALTDLGIAYHEAAEDQRAKELLTSARSQFVDLVDAYGQVHRFRQRLAACEDSLGQVLLDSDESAETATALLSSATSRYTDLVDRSRRPSPAGPFQDSLEQAEARLEYVEGVAIAQSHYAQALHRQGNRDEAKPYFAAAIDLLAQLVAAADRPAYHNALAHVHYRFGLMLYEQDEAAAREQFVAARDRWTELGGDLAASYAHDLAVMLLVCPDANIRDLQLAQTYAARAVDLAPQNPRYLSTAALASLLADEDAATAKAALEQVKTTRGHWIDRDFFAVALAELADGQSQRAAASLAEGIRWMDANRPYSADSLLLRQLAEVALEDKLADLENQRE